MSAVVPAARGAGAYRIAVVCLGNICRSPMADVVLQARLAQAGLDGAVEVTSGGTSDWHVGEPMDARAAATLTAAGYDPSRHRARHFPPGSPADFDLVLVMDHANLREIGTAPNGREIGTAPDGRVRLFRDFDPIDPGGEVPDPYYGGSQGFEEVLAMVERTSAALVAHLQDHHAPGTPR